MTTEHLRLSLDDNQGHATSLLLGSRLAKAVVPQWRSTVSGLVDSQHVKTRWWSSWHRRM